MQNEIPLLYDFIKSEVEGQSINISENVIVAFSNDISYKIHEIALLSRSIMLKSNRFILKDEDIECALKLSFKNLLLVPLNGMQDDKPKVFSDDCSEIVVKISSHSMTPLNLYSKFNFRLESDIVFSNLLKNLLSTDRNIYEHSLTFVRRRNNMDDVLIMLLSTLNFKVDDSFNEGFIIRACEILESVVKNKSISLSENPWRDLCVSMTLKLLWSKINLTPKVTKISRMLQSIISRQYLMSGAIRNMVIETLLSDLDQSDLEIHRYCGTIVGLISLGYVHQFTVEDFIDRLSLLSDASITCTIVNETVAFLLHIMKMDKLFQHVSYLKIAQLLENHFCIESISMFLKEPCRPSLEPLSAVPPTTTPTLQPSIMTSHNVPFATVSTQIDILLHGGSIDDLTSAPNGIDDLPPLLFRKPYIQPPLSHLCQSIRDIGFQSHISRPMEIVVRINGVDNSWAFDRAKKVNDEPFVSEFHSVFQRRRQFIENRTRTAVRTLSRRQNVGGGCVTEILSHSL